MPERYCQGLKYKDKWHKGLEKTLVKKIAKWLKGKDIWHFKVHGSPMQMAGVPDIIAVVCGRAIFIEVKTAKGVVSKIQHHVMGKIHKAGAVVGVARCLEEAIDLVEEVSCD